MTEDIVVRFVTNTEICKVPSQMKKAFEVAKYQFNSDCDWINTENAFKIAKRLTTKSIIFIANPTEIDDFSMLIQKRKKLYGPLVILYCNKNNMVMPRIKSKPIFSLTLNGLIICCSTMDEERRNNIYNKVEMMGGLFSQALTENVTHLVSAISGSKKYYVAINYNKKIMSPTWVEKLWESVCDYRDPKYNEFPFSEMKCPIFSGCIMSVSGFVSIDKIKLKELIETNGGEYSAKMKKNFCTHLIVLEAKGEKYNHAKTWGKKIFIVSASWIHSSIDANHRIEEFKFKVDEIKEKVLNSDFSILKAPIIDSGSNIYNDNSSSTIIDDTFVPKHVIKTNGIILANISSEPDVSDVADTMDHIMNQYVLNSKIDESNQILDKNEDYKIYETPLEKLNITESLRPTIQKLDFTETEEKIKSTPKEKNCNVFENDFFLNFNVEKKIGIFENCSFFLSGIGKEDNSYNKQMIISNGGKIIENSARVIADYMLLPLLISTFDKRTAKTVVNVTWLKMCIHDNVIHNPESQLIYQPIFIDKHLLIKKKIFNSVNMCFSGYNLVIRTVLMFLATKICGGHCSDNLYKNVDGDVQPTTVLICDHKYGAKYNAALEWGLPVVRYEWIIRSIESMKIMKFDDYLNSSNVELKLESIDEIDTACQNLNVGSIIEQFKTPTERRIKRQKIEKPLLNIVKDAINTASESFKNASNASNDQSFKDDKYENKQVVWKDPDPEKFYLSLEKNFENTTISPRKSQKVFKMLSQVEKSEQTKVFMFSLIDETKKNKFIKFLNQHGFKTLDEKVFNVDCTHLIANKSIQNDKFLIAMALGKWIVKSLYIDDCLKENCILDETKYEWGWNSKNDLAISAMKWRKYMQLPGNENKGAFYGWIVLIVSNNAHLTRYKRIIECGKGKVYTNIEAQIIINCTHILTENVSDEQIKQISNFKEKTYKIDYLSTYLKRCEPKMYL